MPEVLIPAYVASFRCLGGECPDTCCAGWNISVVREGWNNYMQNPVLRERAESLAGGMPTGEEGDVALCKSTSGAPCLMCSADRLCLVQQVLGEEALPDTCYTYPRVAGKFGERWEMCLNLSCPEAARLAMNEAGAFDFTSAALPLRQSLVFDIQPVAGFSLEQMDDVRALAIQLFKTQGVSNIERMALLGLLCEGIDRLIETRAQGSLDQLIGEIVSLVESGSFINLIAGVPENHSLGANVFSLLIGDLSRKGTSDNQREVLAWTSGGLGFDTGRVRPDPETVAENYRQGLVLLEPVAGILDELLQRYLLNEVLRHYFPWGQLTSAVKGYRHLLLLFGCLRLMLVAVAKGRNQTPDRALMVRVIQVFSRVCTHDPQFLKRADHLLSGAGFDSLEKLFSLIK